MFIQGYQYVDIYILMSHWTGSQVAAFYECEYFGDDDPTAGGYFADLRSWDADAGAFARIIDLFADEDDYRLHIRWATVRRPASRRAITVDAARRRGFIEYEPEIRSFRLPVRHRHILWQACHPHLLALGGRDQLRR